MKKDVRDYYGQTLQSSADLQTNACCDAAPPAWLKPWLAMLHDEVVSRYYGCGLVAPQQLEGMRVLDLGCGSGRDVYLLSALVGERGEVVGVDMTPEQLAVAERHQAYHQQAFGHARSNVRFVQGDIEHLDELGLESDYFDIVVSNCVINLCTDKARALNEVFRVLRPGGEMYFSDVYGDRRMPDMLLQDPVLYGECLSGALYWQDFLTLARQAGFLDPRLVEDRPITIGNDHIRARLAPARFFSATYRLFKLAGLEPACEDYGQAVIYRGTLPESPSAFVLDNHHRIERGKVFPVCGNTWRMLHDSRFAGHFEFIGDFSTHYGVFPDCGSRMPFTSDSFITPVGGCC
ncbi:arsenic (+3 oxidation state) methyltransferase [Alcanivorax sp. S71-1-4]|uniref:methyltransferase domain-containing protein n=1 Tax=Alcanivorax sp. S71-1-4 TaxID=1177159 RepID=UPI0013575B61|nr:methyltransferase domain-containing protein [Alcanivorax sp. S71-1-4]KAF0810260.1 arsenic (+3 oxidation state) methyltransferase [Alcanivorax sp. S71-1-4]